MMLRHAKLPAAGTVENTPESVRCENMLHGTPQDFRIQAKLREKSE